MADQILFTPRADNTKLAQDFASMDAMARAMVSKLKSTLASVGGGSGNTFLKSFSTASGAQSQLQSQLNRTQTSVNALDRSLGRMTSTLSGGLGIGIALGGLALLERGFERAMEKARQFQTAQLGIAASLASAYTLQGNSGTITGGAAFARAEGDATRINSEIIQRQAKNILTYQEQLGAFQSSVVAGAQKGFSPEQTLRVSEQLAIVAKTLGLHGEEIANASRIALGGATNVSRSTIGRALGITNEDIKSRSGDDLEKFLMDKTKGFQLAAPAFKDSIEGVLSTLQARVDVFASHVGDKFFKMAQPMIKGFGDFLQGQNADKYATMLANIFESALKALEALASSPAIPLLTQFLTFIAGYGDKLILAAAFFKITAALSSGLSALGAFRRGLFGIAEGMAQIEKAAPGAVSGEEAVVEAAARGGGGGGESFGPHTSAAEETDGWVPWGTRPNSFRAAQYGRIKEEIGNIAPGPSGWMETSGGAAFSQAFNDAAIRRRAAELEIAENRKFSRAQVAGQFNEWQGLMAQPGVSAEEHEAALAKVSEQKAANAVERRQMVGSMAMNGLGRLQSGAGAAGLAFIGTELARPYTDRLTGETGGAGLQAGLVSGAGMLGMGIAPEIVAPIAAAIGGVTALNNAFKGLTEQVDRAKNALQAQYEQNPLAARIATREAEYAQAKGMGILTPRALESMRKNMLEQNALDFDAGQAKVTRDTSKNNAQSLLQTLTGSQKAYELGYGGANAASAINAKSRFDEASIGVMQASEELPVTDAQKARAQALFDKAEAARDAWRENQRVTRIDKGLGYESMPNNLKQYESLDDTQQALAGTDFRRQNLTRQMDEQLKRQFTQEGLMAGLNPDKLGGQYAKAKAENEVSIIGQRGSFNNNQDYNNWAERMRKKFDEDFGLPLKRLEGQMDGLNLGVKGENVAEEAQLAYKITSQKLQDLADQWMITQGEADKLKLQAGAERTANIRADAYSKANQAYGTDAPGRILGKEASEEMVNNFKKAGILSVDNKYLAEAYDRRASIEEERGHLSGQDFATFQAKAGASLQREMQASLKDTAREIRDKQFSVTDEQRQYDKTIATAPLRTASAALRVQDAQYALTRAQQNPAALARNTEMAQIGLRRAELAPTLESGEGPYSQVASAIRFSVDAQKGFDPEKYAAAYRESIQLKQQEADVAKQSLAAAVSNAQLDQKADSALVKAKLELADALLAQAEVGQEVQTATQRHTVAQQDLAQDLVKLRKQQAQQVSALGTVGGLQAGGVTAAAAQAGAPTSASEQNGGLTISIPVNIGSGGELDSKTINNIVDEVITKLKDTLSRTAKKTAA